MNHDESPGFAIGAEVVVQDRRGWKGVQYVGPFRVTEIKKRPRVICINSGRYPEWSWNGQLRNTTQVILLVSTPELIETIRLQYGWNALINFCDDIVRIGNGPIGSIEDIVAALEALKKVTPKALLGLQVPKDSLLYAYKFVAETEEETEAAKALPDTGPAP